MPTPSPSPSKSASRDIEPAGLLSRDPLMALLERAKVARSSLIQLTGPSGLSALLWLCRHGFERVGYVRPGAGPHEEPDALIVAHTCDEATLARLLSEGPHVRAGGVLVFQSPAPHDPSETIDRLLESHGYAIEQRLRGHRRQLHVARRGARPALSLAA